MIDCQCATRAAVNVHMIANVVHLRLSTHTLLPMCYSADMFILILYVCFQNIYSIFFLRNSQGARLSKKRMTLLTKAKLDERQVNVKHYRVKIYA